MNLSELHDVVKREGLVFLSYGGFLSQSLISAMTENLEREALDKELGMRLSNQIFVVFIELAQNMMKYTRDNENISPQSESFILVGKDKNENYFVTSRNIILNEHAQGLHQQLLKLKSLDAQSIKQRYRELRRQAREISGSTAGIGFYEVAKSAQSVDYEIVQLDQETSAFIFKAVVGAKE